MTRREFLDNVDDFYGLLEFCNENGCDICEDIYDSDTYDECVDDDLAEATREDGWRTIRDWLDDLPTGYDFYRREGFLTYSGVDNDFEDYKSDVLEWADDNEIWDEEDDEEEEEEGLEEDVVEDDDFEVEDDIPFDDMMRACTAPLAEQEAHAEAEQQKQNELLGAFLNAEVLVN